MIRAAVPMWICAFTLSTACLAQQAPGGAYIGYYQEDPRTNPEDPVPGSIHLRLPADDAGFSGEMFFTYIGCQSSNVGRVSGTKSGPSLTGRWAGVVDEVAQAGTFAGTYDAAAGYYTGTYTNDNGKQYRDLRPCIEYYIAPNGTWALFPIERNVPADFTISVTATGARWTRVANAAGYLITVLDAAVLASPQGNAIVWQSILDADAASASLANAHLTGGRQYVVSVAALGPEARHIAFGSSRFVAPQ